MSRIPGIIADQQLHTLPKEHDLDDHAPLIHLSSIKV
jgi:hypothetical protein